MNQSQSQRSLANVCLFCNDELQSPSMCKFCGFKFCDEHMAADSHQCIKTRYFEHIKKTNNSPNVANGKFRVVCEICGYASKKPAPIEYAGEELEQHTQMVGCTQNIFLEEVESSDDESTKKVKIIPKESTSPTPAPVSAEDQNSSDNSKETSIVEQILKLSSLKEKGMISDEEFEFIKKELINKLK